MDKEQMPDLRTPEQMHPPAKKLTKEVVAASPLLQSIIHERIREQREVGAELAREAKRAKEEQPELFDGADGGEEKSSG